MTEKAVIIHKSVVEQWAKRDKPPLDIAVIQRALSRINLALTAYPKADVVLVEESAATGFKTLPSRVGKGNSAVLFGARAGVCMKKAREVLEEADIPVSIDVKGSLP